MNKYDAEVVNKMLNKIDTLSSEMLDGVRRNRDRRIEEVRDNWNQRYNSLREEMIDLCHHVMNTSYAGQELKDITMATASRLGLTIVVEEEKQPELPSSDVEEIVS